MPASSHTHESALARAFVLATRGGVPRRALLVALVVGTVLNAINQGDRLLMGIAPNWPKLVLTYVVPYVVSTHGAVGAMLSRSRGGQD